MRGNLRGEDDSEKRKIQTKSVGLKYSGLSSFHYVGGELSQARYLWVVKISLWYVISQKKY